MATSYSPFHLNDNGPLIPPIGISALWEYRGFVCGNPFPRLSEMNQIKMKGVVLVLLLIISVFANSCSLEGYKNFLQRYPYKCTENCDEYIK